MATIEIDGRELQAQPGETIIEVADRAGIYIPRFCYHDKLSVAANCRMCMVEVERAPKPMVACATPVAEGMKVSTVSKLAVEAQEGTLEFLLINHPLDCPICDQGGECPLQDQALGYGGDASRYVETKRVVADHGIGPLIETEMTRCIHCTRCVRFGAEVAGIMEFGLAQRGEHLKIDTFLGREVSSEVSGNVIDLCPVGALTSKPYRFTARTWEMISHASISPHDCVGTNIDIQTLRGDVKRVLPRENEQINECWIADRDRYSYEALIGDGRLGRPMIRTACGMVETSWEAALKKVAAEFGGIAQESGPESLGALVSPTATLEEFYLVQKLMRALGCGNVDHRLRQVDFMSDASAPLYPGMEISIEELESADAILLVGSNIRKEQPLLGLRARKAWLSGAKIASISSVAHDFNFAVDVQVVLPPGELPDAVESLAKALSGKADGASDALASMLSERGRTAVIVLGQSAIAHPRWTSMRQSAQAIADATGAKICTLPAANSAAGWIAGCLPHRLPNGVQAGSAGMDSRQMVEHPREGYLLFNADPPRDMTFGTAAATAMAEARFVVSLQCFDEIPEYVDVVLPIAAFTENAGTFINCAGQVQQSTAATAPFGEARPGWKVLRVLGNFLGAGGFEFVSIDQVRDEANPMTDADVPRNSPEGSEQPFEGRQAQAGELELIADYPIYSVDSVVRNAPALQQTADAVKTRAYMHPQQLSRLGLGSDAQVTVTSNGYSLATEVAADDRLPDNCVYVPAGDKPLPVSGTPVRVEPVTGS